METQDSNLKYLKAKHRVEKVKGFYHHLAAYLIINLIITGFKVSNDLDSWDHFIDELLSVNVLSVWTIWGLFLVLHFISLVYVSGWEARKIEELMAEELSKQSKQLHHGKV